MKNSPNAACLLLAFLVFATAAPAQDECDLSFTDTPCSSLPCPTLWQEKPCPYQDSQDPPIPHPPGLCHPYPQPHPDASKQCTRMEGGVMTTEVNTGEGFFTPSNPFDSKTFPGTNFLPNVYTNAFDGAGNEMFNTLPSTPTVPYNLHEGAPVVSEIDRRSPKDDLESIFSSILEGQVPEVIELQGLKAQASKNSWSKFSQRNLALKEQAMVEDLRSALDILEGEPVPYRAYSGIPLLHYTGPEKVKAVEPVFDSEGKIIGGNVDVHQIWYGQHIESDTAFVDPTEILGAVDEDGNPVTWTITYTVDVLTDGHDDFSPFVTYTDDPALAEWIQKDICPPQPCASDDPANDPSCTQKGPSPNVGMDQSFFNMEEGTRTVFKIKMAAAKYLNLVYTWGWRMHPPRIQVIEKAIKKINYGCNEHPGCPQDYDGCALPQLEQHVFCNPEDPATESIVPGEDYVPPTQPPFPFPPRTNSCNLASLPNCGSVRCGEGEPRWNPDGSPTQCEKNKLYAIGKIGDLSPAKRMWNGVQKALKAAEAGRYRQVSGILKAKVLPAFTAWQDRTHLPCFQRDPSTEKCIDGVEPDPDSDITILYVNNTIYGQLTAGGWVRWPEWGSRYWEWKAENDAFLEDFAEWEVALAAWEEDHEVNEPVPLRPRAPAGPPLLHVTAYNDDRFPHSYTIADFGGVRGWENQFKSSVKVAGSGCWFTFGRAYWWMNTGAPNGFLCVPPAVDEPTVHKFEVQFNFEASRRLRFYQFDPMHHDVAIYSIH